MRRLPSLILLIAMLVVGGCGDDGSSPQPECDRSVTSMSVTAGTSPTFSWIPRCSLGSLFVFRVSDNHVMWEIHADGWDMETPVRYGVTPRGLETGHAPEPLVVGTTYEVAIAVPGTGTVPVFGFATFTP